MPIQQSPVLRVSELPRKLQRTARYIIEDLQSGGWANVPVPVLMCECWAEDENLDLVPERRADALKIVALLKEKKADLTK